MPLYALHQRYLHADSGSVPGCTNQFKCSLKLPYAFPHSGYSHADLHLGRWIAVWQTVHPFSIILNFPGHMAGFAAQADLGLMAPGMAVNVRKKFLQNPKRGPLVPSWTDEALNVPVFPGTSQGRRDLEPWLREVLARCAAALSLSSISERMRINRREYTYLYESNRGPRLANLSCVTRLCDTSHSNKQPLDPH
jgi:hypothetical protein